MCLVLEVGKVYVSARETQVKIVYEDDFSTDRRYPFLGITTSGSPVWFDRAGVASGGYRIIKPAPTPHPHAESMMLYAQDAAECEKPWLRWELCGKELSRGWRNLYSHPNWWDTFDYRRKPQSEWPPEAC